MLPLKYVYLLKKQFYYNLLLGGGGKRKHDDEDYNILTELQIIGRRKNVGVMIYESDEDNALALQSFVNGYINKGGDGGEGYGVMTTDHNKHTPYSLALRELFTREGLPGMQWLEIGPGAHAVLSKLVLESSPANRILCIEGNRVAAQQAIKVLQSHDYGPRWKVLPGLTTDSEIQRQFKEESYKIEGVISELFGMIMSAEYIMDITMMHQVHHQSFYHDTGQPFMPQFI